VFCSRTFILDRIFITKRPKAVDTPRRPFISRKKVDGDPLTQQARGSGVAQGRCMGSVNGLR
jgi:hypothetical protein